jgi:hypothetical protein
MRRVKLYILVEKPEGKSQLESPMSRWGNNIKLNFRKNSVELIQPNRNMPMAGTAGGSSDFVKFGLLKRCFITIDFQLCFRTCHQGSSRKQTGTGIEWNASVAAYADYINSLGKNIHINKTQKLY